LETYWKLKNNYKLYFYDENKRVTSILFKKNEYEFAGKSMVSNATFSLKKKHIDYANFNVVSHRPHKIKVAFCLRGAVSRKYAASIKANELYNINSDNDYINIQAVAKSINQHIFECNPNIQCDTFIHSWNTDLEETLNNIYRPIRSLYEDNNIYQDEINFRCQNPSQFSAVSQALTIKRVLQLKEQYERQNKFLYDIVILYRPDVLLWKNMYLNQYDVNHYLYVNHHPDYNGDFHFIMSSDTAQNFKGLYDSPLIGNAPSTFPDHGWIKNYIIQYMKQEMRMDDIIPGKDQEVARPDKLRQYTVNQIDYQILEHYGITKDYIFS
jgi:hypothetical protein